VGAFGEPYKIILDDKLLKEVVKAQRMLKRLPWDGEMFLSVEPIPLANNHQFSCEAVVRKNNITLHIEGPEGWEPLIELGVDLFSLPDIYASKAFILGLSEFVWCLSIDDLQLVEKIKENLTKIDQNK
jgi:hypothetical protein